MWLNLRGLDVELVICCIIVDVGYANSMINVFLV
jgi:hypothetical protein